MATSLHTWARLRSPIGNEYTATVGGPTDNNLTYAGQVFVSASDNSPLRTYYNPLNIAGVFQMFFTLNTIYPGAFGEWHANGGTGNVLPQEQIDELVGELVSYSGGTPGSFTMNIHAWGTGGQSTVGTGTITAIGKLTLV